jgi:hypothetical protein
MGLELRAFTLSHSTSPIFVKVYFRDRILQNYLPRLTSNHDAPDLCLLSSWDYRCEPLVTMIVQRSSNFPSEARHGAGGVA